MRLRCELHKLNKLENFDDQFMGEVAIHPQIQVVCFWLGEVDRETPNIKSCTRQTRWWTLASRRENTEKAWTKTQLSLKYVKMVNHISFLQLNVVDRTMWDESCWQFQPATWRQTTKKMLRSRTHETSAFARYWWLDIWEVSKKKAVL